MLGECKKHGIKTFVTMLHYDTPGNLVTTYGGWKNRKTIDFFARYVETIVTELAIWSISGCLLTSSMQRVFRLGTGSVWSRRRGENFDRAIFQCLHHEFVANARAVEIVHRLSPDTPVGGMIARFCTYPATCRPEDNMQAIHDDQYSNWFYTDVMARGKYPAYMNRYFDACDIEIQMEPGDEELIARNTVDFLAFSYYFSQVSTCDQDGRRLREIWSWQTRTLISRRVSGAGSSIPLA